MAHMLILGRGWVGSTIELVANKDPRIDQVTVIDPPFDPLLAPRNNAATGHLRQIIHDNEIDSIINACGRVSGTDSEMEDANHRFVEWLCGALDGTGVRLVHIGSASEYGDPNTASPVTEAHPVAPVGAYATTKAAGTDTVLNAHYNGLDATAARVFNIIGYPIPAVSPVHQWLGDLTDLSPGGGEVVVWWPPTTRDFSLIEDIARALIDLCLIKNCPPLINVCSGTALRYDDIVIALANELGLSITIRSLDRPGIETVVGDPRALQQLIGWSPHITAKTLAKRVTGGDL